jgi:hypothetical protein
MTRGRAPGRGRRRAARAAREVRDTTVGVVAAGALLVALLPALFAVEAVDVRLAGLVGRAPLPDFLLGVAIGAAPLMPATAVARRRRRGVVRPWHPVLLGLQAGLGLWALLTLPGRDGEPPRMREQAPYVASGAFAALPLDVVLVVLAERRGFLARPGAPGHPFAVRDDATGGPRRGHESVTILDVHPDPGEPDPWIGYYVATCGCGWTGEQTTDLDAARFEARRHAPGVEPVVTRPDVA